MQIISDNKAVVGREVQRGDKKAVETDLLGVSTCEELPTVHCNVTTVSEGLVNTECENDVIVSSNETLCDIEDDKMLLALSKSLVRTDVVLPNLDAEFEEVCVDLTNGSSAGKKTYSSNSCDRECSSPSPLSRHMSSHSKDKIFACTFCDFRCQFGHVLKRHILIHTGEKPFACELCDYKCGNKDLLKKHEMRHTGEKPHACDSCDFRCVDAHSMKYHLEKGCKVRKVLREVGEIESTAKLKYSCTYCNYKCTFSQTLKRHVMTHTKEKPYSCDLCDYKCAYSHLLKRHRMRYHTGEKPYACDSCEFRSLDRHRLKYHLEKGCKIRKALRKSGDTGTEAGYDVDGQSSRTDGNHFLSEIL